MYDYRTELNTECRRQQKRMQKKDIIETSKKWNYQSEGSAEIWSSSFSAIFEAYNEYCENY